MRTADETQTIEESQTIEETRPDTSYSEPGDHERLAHYVRKSDQMAAAIEGTPVRALCGKVWVPTRDGERFPVCPECKEIYESMKA
jgi:hypothetical protein